jgi:phage virion morphogenesis protein
MTARIEIVADTVSAALQETRAALRGDGQRLMLEDIGEYLLRSTRDRAAQEKAPDGTPWAPLSPRYKRFKDKKRPGVPKLKFDFHMLGDQFSQQVAGDTLLVGTNAKYGAIHQFGGDIDRPARSTEVFFKRERDGTVGNRFVSRRKSNFAQRVTLPAYKITMTARPWLGLSREDETEVLAIAAEHVLGSASG